MFGAPNSKNAGTVTPPVTNDPQFNYVTALFNGDGTNGARNNTFLDSSSNAFTITRNGTPTQGTAAPFGPNWSNYFNVATTDYLNTTSGVFDAVMATTTGLDATFECWVKPASLVTGSLAMYSSCIFGKQDVYTALTVNAAGAVIYHIYSGSANNFLMTSTGLVGLGTWTHIAVVWTNNNVKIYVNGVQQASGTRYVMQLTTTTLSIGHTSVAANSAWNGYISNCRFVSGTAVYTSAFTPPTAPLTAITNTQLLTCQSTYFKDNSANNYAITVSGTPSVQRFSPFINTASYSPSVYGGAMYFGNGTTNELDIASNAVFNVDSVPWTIEAFVYVTATTTVYIQWVAGRRNPASGYNYSWAFGVSGTTPTVTFIDSAFNIYTGSSTFPINTWTHIAATYDGTSLSMYQNGVRVFGPTAVGNTDYSFPLSIGNYSVADSPYFQGYISNLRMVKASPIYTGATYTIPTAPLTAITGTAVLLSGTNAGAYDSAMITTVTTEGSAQISTTQKKYGTAALYFPSTTTDCLSAPVSPNYALGTGAWTIECWAYSSISGNGCIVDTRATSTSTTGIAVGVNSSLTPYIIVNNATVNFTASVYLSNTWQYMTFQSTGTAVYCWINGVPNGSTTYSNNLTDKNLTIGNFINKPSASGFKGYIDDLRITKGYGRYTPTVSFTPPTAALPTQ